MKHGLNLTQDPVRIKLDSRLQLNLQDPHKIKVDTKCLFCCVKGFSVNSFNLLVFSLFYGIKKFVGYLRLKVSL